MRNGLDDGPVQATSELTLLRPGTIIRLGIIVNTDVNFLSGSSYLCNKNRIYV